LGLVVTLFCHGHFHFVKKIQPFANNLFIMVCRFRADVGGGVEYGRLSAQTALDCGTTQPARNLCGQSDYPATNS